MSKKVRRAWNGGSPEAAMAAAVEATAQVKEALKAHHLAWLRGPSLGRVDAPFRDSRVPGWVYLPIEDVVIMEETAQRIFEIYWAQADQENGR